MLESELPSVGGAGGGVLSRVVSALWAAVMSLSESAVETLERNSPNGLLESALAGVSSSTSARYFSAEVVSPDLIAEMRLERALSKGFWLLEEEVPEAELVDDVASSDINRLL